MLDLHSTPAPVALLATHELLIDVAHEKQKTGGDALENGDERVAV